MNNQTIERQKFVPKYGWLQNLLIEQIQSDAYQIGDKLCTDNELKTRYQLSTSTVCHALSELERAGLIIRKQGSGTFVKSKSVVGQQTGHTQRTLLICGAKPVFEQMHDNVNWFIGNEIYRGVINTCRCYSKIILRSELFVEIDAMPANELFGLVTMQPDPTTETQLVNRHIPYVVIDQSHQYRQLRANTVTIDHIRGVYDGMAYLTSKLGHRHIAFIGPDKAKLAGPHRDRWAGYAIGLQAHDLPMREELVIVAPSGTIDGGYQAARELLARQAKFTAIFVDTDTKALGAIKALRDAHLNVPEDVSVLGFDDIPEIDKTEPPLTTVRMPYYEAGAEAVKLLESMPDTNGNRLGRILESRLVIRNSCAAAK